MNDRIYAVVGLAFIALILIGLGINQVTLEKRLRNIEQRPSPVVVSPTAIPSPTVAQTATPSVTLRPSIKPTTTLVPTK